MLIKVGMVLVCSYYAYAPELSRSGKVELKNIQATTLFQEGDHMLVSYRFKDNANINYLGDQELNKYEMEDIRDLQQRCKEQKNGK